jgi:protein tyrosine/serine phosphatase
MKLFPLSFIFFVFALPAAADLLPPKNFHEIEPGVYRGARPEDSNMEFIASKQTVKNSRTLTIIDLQGGDPLLFDLAEPGETQGWIDHEKTLALKLGLSFISRPLNSAGAVTAAEVKEINEALAYMKRAYENPTQFQIYLHCEHGVDRTGLVAALFRVQIENWPPQKAFEEWQNYGHKGLFDKMVTHALDEYFFEVTNWVPSEL